MHPEYDGSFTHQIDQNPLRTLSIVTDETAARLNILTSEQRLAELKREMGSWANEAIENQVVSLPYYYWFGDDGRLYRNPGKQEYDVVKIDPDERSGWPKRGFEILGGELREIPNKVVLWYSPQGPAAFTDDPSNKYCTLKPFGYGQLYVQHFDGERVSAVAIKVHNEQVVQDLFGQLGADVPQSDFYTPHFIRHHLLTPHKTHLAPDEFLGLELPDNPFVFKDSEGRRYVWSDITEAVRLAFAGKLAPQVDNTDIASELAFTKHITGDDVARAYLKYAHRYMREWNVNRLQVFGSCGGDSVNRVDIDAILNGEYGVLNAAPDIFGSTPLDALRDIYSSVYRTLSSEGSSFPCPKCGTPIPTGKGKKKCPNILRCGVTKEEYRKESGVACA